MEYQTMDFDLQADGWVAEPEAQYNANRELTLAWQIVEETGANLFLTGRAGTGKTTFLRKLRETSAKQMVVLAPTGVAAINARGNTIHSFFQLPFAPYIPGKGFVSADRRFLNMSRQKKRIISSLSLLVIDEISMVRPDVLDAIDSILRRLRNSSRPFGGLQLLLIGDLRQLPPVVKGDEWELLKDHYPTPYFFESHALKKAGFHTVELTVVYRQNDAAFLDILNAIRDGRVGNDTLAALNTRHIPGFHPDDSEGYIRLTTHNRAAAAINDRRLAALPAALYSFQAEIQGDFPESAFPADLNLQLKEGAQVMFIKNDSGTARRYYNGLIGRVTAISDEKICVQPSDGSPMVEVEVSEWENTRYVVDEATKKVSQETTGVFRQYPLQLAWAITIHKSQGLTFEKAIIDAAHSFAAGQTYVALSRCRSLEGLVLDSPVHPHAVITDSDVNEFIDDCGRRTPDARTVSRMKNDYAFVLLEELFDFEPLRRAYADFERQAREALVPLYPYIESELTEFRQKISDSLCEVARKFLSRYRDGCLADAPIALDSHLTARIRKGCAYFLDLLEDLDSFISHLPKDIDNQTYAERLNNAFESLKYTVGTKCLLLEAHTRGEFSAKSFITAKSKAALTLEREGPKKARPRSGKQEKPKVQKKPKGYTIFETLGLWEKGKSITEIADVRGLKEGTIGSHLTELIRMGRVKLDDVVSPDIQRDVKAAMAESPGLTPVEIFEKVNSMRPSAPVPTYLLRIVTNIIK